LILCIGANENTKVGVAGESAGGLIAACICREIKNLDFQVETSSPMKMIIVFFSVNRFLSVLNWIFSIKLHHEKNLINRFL
jgi:acetyl esterase/lipase